MQLKNRMFVSIKRQCSKKRVQELKNVKKHVFLFKKRKKRTYSFTGNLITLPLVGYSITVKSSTSNILLRNADTRNLYMLLRTLCDKRP